MDDPDPRLPIVCSQLYSKRRNSLWATRIPQERVGELNYPCFRREWAPGLEQSQARIISIWTWRYSVCSWLAIKARYFRGLFSSGATGVQLRVLEMQSPSTIQVIFRLCVNYESNLNYSPVKVWKYAWPAWKDAKKDSFNLIWPLSSRYLQVGKWLSLGFSRWRPCHIPGDIAND